MRGFFFGGSWAASAVLMLGLAACTPRTVAAPPPVQPTTPVTGASFYPYETGLQWNYLPEGDAPSSVPYVLRGQGPTIFEGQPVMATQLTGRGADQTWYRTYDSTGVKLRGIKKPGVVISLNPAWQEMPAPAAWQVGLSWEGTSQIVIRDDNGKVQAQGSLKYRYDVQDQRQVKTPAGTFNVWVVTQQISDTVGGLFPEAQQFWFSPYVGQVRTPEELVLTARNFKAQGK